MCRRLGMAARAPRGHRKTPKRARPTTIRRWSAKVMETSDALDLEPGVFKRGPKAIAGSLRRSAETSRRRKTDPFRSAMSMLTFYINRAGRNLSAGRRRVLEQAKDELRVLYGRPRAARRMVAR